MRGLKWAAVVLFVLAAAETAFAGWEIEQSNYNRRSSGKEIGRTKSTLLVSRDRVRSSDGKVTTIFDYKADRVTLMLPAKKIYWEGSSDEYLAAARAHNPKRRLAPGQMEKMPKLVVNVETLADTDAIAGKPTKKYLVKLDGYPFQEIWVTDPFGLEKDLDFQRYQAMQLKLAQGVRGNYGLALTVLQKDPLYQTIATRFPMRTHSYLGEAIIGTEVVRVTPKDLGDSEFAVPKDFQRASLTQIVDAQNDPAK